MVQRLNLASYLPPYQQRYRYALYLTFYLLFGLLSEQFTTIADGYTSLWYLPSGILFAMFLREGRKSLLFGFFMSMFSTAVLYPNLFSGWSMLKPLIAVFVYGYAAIALRRASNLQVRISCLQESGRFLGIVGSTVLLSASLSTALMAVSGRIPSGQFITTFLSWSVGDGLGILTLTPVFLSGHEEILGKSRQVIRQVRKRKKSFNETMRALLPVWRLLFQAAGIIIVLWIVFGWSYTRQVQPFYLCFLPLIWIALANGIEGTARGIAAMNLGTMLAMIFTGSQMNNLPIFMLIFSSTSLILGSVITESKRTETILRSSEQSLRSVYDNVYDAIVVHETGGRIIDVNDKLLLLLNIKHDQAVNKHFTSLFQPAVTLPDDLEERWSLAVEGKPQLLEWKMRWPDDRTLDMEIYLSRVKIGSQWAVLSTIRDITGHKESQRRQVALRKISEAASTAETVESLFLTFHRAIGDLMPADNFYICLYDKENDLLTFPYFVDEYDSAPEPMPYRRGLTEYVLRTGKPMLVDPEEFDELVALGEVESIGAPSIDWLGVPLKVQDVTIGVMAVQSYTEGIRFNRDNLNFLVLVSPHVAMAIEHRRAEETLQHQHDFIRTIYDSSPDAILTIGLDNRVTDCNPATLNLLECDSKEQIIGLSAFQFMHEQDRDATRDQLVEVRQAGIAKHIEFRLITCQGRTVIVELSASLIDGDEGSPSFFICHLIDITQRKLAEDALRISEERYSLATLGANDGLWDWDLVTGHIYYSPRWRSMVGYDHDLGGSPDVWFSRVHPDDLPRLKNDIEIHLSGQSPQLENEYRMLHADGTYRWMMVRGLGIGREGGVPHRFAGSQTDITRRKATEQRLIHDALHDALTALPNRVLFLDRLGQALKWSGRHVGSKFAVIFLDLDRFKVINDSLGHQAGDEILISIARRLEGCLREQDTVARLSGDEFAILIQEIEGPGDAVRVANRVLSEIARPHQIGGQPIFTTASMGITLSDTNYQLPEELLRDADTAMYQAKGRGGGRYVIFNKDMHTDAVRLLELETDLRQALTGEQFCLLYQPILSLVSEQVVGAEALLRWNHPTRGLRMPSDFIQVAEETGLIVPIGDWVMRKSCQQLKVWHELGLSHLSMSVNISDRQFQHQDLPALVSSVLSSCNLRPNDLIVEITENINLMQTEAVEDILSRLSAIGVNIAMDDFGTGYASLNTLMRMAVNCVKIDRSFVASIDNNPHNDLIISSIIQMAHNLGFVVVAEGVETEQQVEFLKREGCDMIQGYLYSPPLTAAEFEQLVCRQAGRIIDPVDQSLRAPAD